MNKDGDHQSQENHGRKVSFGDSEDVYPEDQYDDPENLYGRRKGKGKRRKGYGKGKGKPKFGRSQFPPFHFKGTSKGKGKYKGKGKGKYGRKGHFAEGYYTYASFPSHVDEEDSPSGFVPDLSSSEEILEYHQVMVNESFHKSLTARCRALLLAQLENGLLR